MRRQPFAAGLTALGLVIPALFAAPAPAAA